MLFPLNGFLERERAEREADYVGWGRRLGRLQLRPVDTPYRGVGGAGDQAGRAKEVEELLIELGGFKAMNEGRSDSVS